MDKKAVILLSGGLDSLTSAAIAKNGGYQLYALTFNYGQRHQEELCAAQKCAEALAVKEHRIVEIDLRVFGKSALTDHIEVPKNTLCFSNNEQVPITYVPARNTIFLSFALAYAETIDAFNIYIGANAVDYSGYPDCREAYIKSFEAMANLATVKTAIEGKHMHIKAPLMHMNKEAIIQRGLALGLDYGITHSCYDPLPSGKACGQCDACLIRQSAFLRLGLGDPVLEP